MGLVTPRFVVLQSEVGKLHGHVEVLQLKVKEQREEVAAGRKELKHLKRTMRTLEVKKTFPSHDLGSCCLLSPGIARSASRHSGMHLPMACTDSCLLALDSRPWR